MGRSRYRFAEPGQPHFMTCTVLNWIPIFTRPDTVKILLESLKFLANEGLKLYAYVILENHMHLIAQSKQLDKDMARFKSYSARQLIGYLTDNNVAVILDQLAFYKKAHKKDRAYQLWQEGVHPEWIQNEEIMRQKVEYIHRNPVERGYVDQPEHWRYSSARNYAGEEGLIEVCKVW
jgi:REP element-mobilizing transposase RayT